jgi:hypothetical protein
MHDLEESKQFFYWLFLKPSLPDKVNNWFEVTFPFYEVRRNALIIYPLFLFTYDCKRNYVTQQFWKEITRKYSI